MQSKNIDLASNVFVLTPQIQEEWDKSQTLIRKKESEMKKMRNRNIKINVFLNEDENKILNEKVKRFKQIRIF